MRFALSPSPVARLVYAVLGVLELGGCATQSSRESLEATGHAVPNASAGRVAVAAAVGGSAAVSQTVNRPHTGSRASAERAAASGASAPYVGDVPARAASSGNTPCGSSEFSVGPCVGKPASPPVPADAGSVDAARPETVLPMADPVQPPADDAGTSSTLAGLTSERCEVIALPDSVRASYQLDAFYRRYASAGGIPIVASEKPAERTLHLACLLVNEMLSERFDVREALLEKKVTFAIVATSEKTTQIPEYRDLPAYYDMRARGLGGHTGLCAEENILCDRRNDPWHGESICVHEYSHTIAIYGLFTVDPTFEDRLADAFSKATNKGLWRDTFAAQDAQEYWAEGVQDWYDTNLESDPPDGVHNSVNTRDELKDYDPTLYKLIDELLPIETRWPNCYRP